MTELVVGNTRIPYVVRESERSRRKRIVVTPGGVEVVVPTATAPAEIADFLHEKRRWVFDTVSTMAPTTTSSDSAEAWANGAKILWRGRRLTVRAVLADIAAPALIYRSRFDVQLPRQTAAHAQASLMKETIEAWMRDRAQHEARALVMRYAKLVGVVVKRVEVRPMLRLWGSCGRDGVIRLDAGFMKLPAHLAAYLAAHEVVHLLHRDHSPAFWRSLRALIPEARRLHEELMGHGRQL